MSNDLVDDVVAGGVFSGEMSFRCRGEGCDEMVHLSFSGYLIGDIESMIEEKRGKCLDCRRAEEKEIEQGRKDDADYNNWAEASI